MSVTLSGHLIVVIPSHHAASNGSNRSTNQCTTSSLVRLLADQSANDRTSHTAYGSSLRSVALGMNRTSDCHENQGYESKRLSIHDSHASCNYVIIRTVNIETVNPSIASLASNIGNLPSLIKYS
jgi:hypothetical protein